MSIFMIFCGIEHFVYADFVATLVPSWIPGSMFWTFIAGIALIGAGAAIILRIKIRFVSTLTGIMIFLWFLVLHIPRAIADPTGHNGNECVSVFEALCFAGFGLCPRGHHILGFTGLWGSSKGLAPFTFNFRRYTLSRDVT